MALATEVTNRYGTASPFLRNLTNHDDPDATSVNSTRLGYAVTAAQAAFRVYAQASFDESIASHVEAGVLGCIAYLKAWSTGQTEPPEMMQFRASLEAIAKVSSRKRITPVAVEPPEREEDLFAGVSPEWPETTTEQP